MNDAAHPVEERKMARAGLAMGSWASAEAASEKQAARATSPQEAVALAVSVWAVRQQL